MSIFRLLLPALGLSLTLTAQATTVVSGHIAGPAGTAVSVSYGPSRLTDVLMHRVKGQVDAKGDFRLELPTLTAPAEAIFAYGEETTTIYLAPGDNLRLALDPEKFDESLRYTGSALAANANNYLAQAFLLFENHHEDTPLVQAATSTPAAMHELADRYRQKRLAFLGSYAASHPLAPAFRAYARQNIDFEWGSNLLYYPQMHQRANAGAAVVLPISYFDFLKVVRPAQDSAQATGGRPFLDFLHAYATDGFAPLGHPTSGKALLATMSQQFGTGATRDLALTKYLLRQLATVDAGTITLLLPDFQRTVHDSVLVQAVRTGYRKRLPLSAGSVAPAFTVQDGDGKPVNLADFKGKVVCLDFWASWCHPCLAEIPATTLLKQQFVGKDVVFLYISVDDKEADWKKALTTHPLASPNSVHTWAKGFESPTPSAYQIETIPAYLLIGRDGRIITSHAPRPSAGETAAAGITAALLK